MSLRANCNFYEILKTAQAPHADLVCLETEHGQTFTFDDIDRMSARFANALHRLGCRRGDRVAVQVDKSPQALGLFFGCLRAGLIYLPLNTAYMASELAHFLSDARPRVFIHREGADASLRELAATLGIPAIEGMDSEGQGSLAQLSLQESDTFDPVRCESGDIATLMYTSGTTGRSKGAMLSHGAVEFCATGLASAWGFTSRDVLLHALPMFHAHGLFVSLGVAFLAGAKVSFHRRFDVGQVLKSLPAATVMMGVPTFYHRLLSDPGFSSQVVSAIRLFTSGSAPLSSQVHQEFHARCGHWILERYGLTETMILTSNPLHGERRSGSVGMPLAGVDLRIVDSNNQIVPTGQIGMIQVRSPGLFSGYWNMPDKTREEYSDDGFFRTGDLGVQADDGFVTITGRAKDLIISGGYNVYPVEVEDLLNQHPSVAESAVFAVPHPDFGEAVAAALILKAGASAPQDLNAWVKARIAGYKAPKHFVIVDELPRNALGKIQKNLLREKYAYLNASTQLNA